MYGTACRVLIFAVESVLARIDAIRMIILAVFNSTVDAFMANRFGFGRLGLSLRVVRNIIFRLLMYGTACRVLIFAVESVLARVDAIRMIILAVFNSAVDAFMANRFGFGRLGLWLFLNRAWS
jgi:hypothetical protein